METYKPYADIKPNIHWYHKENRRINNGFSFQHAKKKNQIFIYFRNIQGEKEKITTENYINRLAYLFTNSKAGNYTNVFATLCNQIRKDALNNPEKVFAPPEKIVKRVLKRLNL